ncbi:histidine phosphatase family protein [Paraburkholderia sp. MMS20-SJTR3]|uniref:Histidine phosphatase family protein n=1 Tax=Paraburkholderia sejongensis TaxID=2886946 RepID=A0ABS8JTK5_9BURK|nr:histidine phosphatase family protein [Paraburkholderia sp. MMS20-SJTR3]MCC8393239.1 histidine phosphatase family protein [Paraburkholderia sp. MMS20-SJTR3]
MNRFRVFLHRVALSLGGLCVGVGVSALAAPGAEAATAVTTKGAAVTANGATPTATAAVVDANTETLVFVRHGEKPREGYGQLNCQGLNRALALPAVIAAKFGKPDAIYAPDPGQQKNDNGHPYYYVRPLATIEPTAIQFQMPVQTPYGLDQIERLGNALVAPAYRGKLIVIAWEHRLIEQLLRQMLAAHGGDAADVPKWQSDDFDSIYIVRLDWRDGTPRASFRHEHQGLDGRSTDCPCAALPAVAASEPAAVSN